jgi:hypothetical protein
LLYTVAIATKRDKLRKGLKPILAKGRSEFNSHTSFYFQFTPDVI